MKCLQCAEYLGVAKRGEQTVKLWSECVRFVDGKRNRSKSLFAGTLSEQFVFVVRRLLDDYHFMPPGMKIAFEAGDGAAFLFLQAYANVRIFTANLDNSDDRAISLDRVECVKVFYHHHQKDDIKDAAKSSIVKWQSEGFVVQATISVQMMKAAVAQLDGRSMPLGGGKGFMDDFRISFLY